MVELESARERERLLREKVELAASWLQSEANRQDSGWSMRRVTSSALGMREGAIALREFLAALGESSPAGAPGLPEGGA